MKKYLLYILFLPITYFFSCTVISKNHPTQFKYSKNQLVEDYITTKNILEAKHPSLYWYTSKDSMDEYFTFYKNQIVDSMSSTEFAWNILSPLINKIHCGHTSIGMNKKYLHEIKNKKFSSFPLHLKVWNDTMAVTANLNPHDSLMKRGTIIKSINGISASEMINHMLTYFTLDGYSYNVNLVKISSNFPSIHRNVYGLSKSYKINYINNFGNIDSTILPMYDPAADTTLKSKNNKIFIIKKLKKNPVNSFHIDSLGRIGIMSINSFSDGWMRFYLRKTFKTLRQKNIQNLIIDVRLNGGGNVKYSTLLTKYISRHPFKIADSVYTNSKTLNPYSRYFKKSFITNIGLLILGRKNTDGKYHLNRFEHHTYLLKSKNHFDGKVIVLVSGPTFSASCLFANVVKNQQGITLLGEETGGGAYGNNGILIPEAILPNTKLVLRMPLFRLIQFQHSESNKGHGIIPDVYVPTNYDAIKKGIDKKMETAKERLLH